MSEKHREVQRGMEAAQVLESAAFAESMAELKAAAVEHWRSLSLSDTKGQELALMMMKVTDKFESILRGRIERGEFARRMLEQEKERGQGQVRRALRDVR